MMNVNQQIEEQWNTERESEERETQEFGEMVDGTDLFNCNKGYH